MSLTQALLDARGNPLVMKVGRIASTSPTRVSCDGGIVAVDGCLASYAPSAGHTVLILANDTNAVILGRLVPA